MRSKNFYTVILVVIASFFITESYAQDPRFSQFYASPLQLNPAMTGVFAGQWRATINYRDQWASILNNNPFRTMAASFDMRYNVLKRDYVAFGVSVLGDQSGVSNFRQTRGNISASYLKQVGGSGYGPGSQYLVAGTQVGLGQNSFDYTNLWFSEQFDNESEILNTNNSNGENAYDATAVFLDINAGLLWYAVIDDNTSVYAGGAINHVNAPNITLLDGQNEVLYMRWVGHAGGEIPLSSELSLLPAFAVMGQGPSLSASAGANIRYTNNDWNEIAIRMGLWTHISNKFETGFHTDAITFAAILELDRWNLGFSYDINASSLTSATNSRGAYELSLIYTQPENRRVRVSCPNF